MLGIWIMLRFLARKPNVAVFDLKVQLLFSGFKQLSKDAHGPFIFPSPLLCSVLFAHLVLGWIALWASIQVLCFILNYALCFILFHSRSLLCLFRPRNPPQSQLPLSSTHLHHHTFISTTNATPNVSTIPSSLSTSKSEWRAKMQRSNWRWTSTKRGCGNWRQGGVGF